MTSTGTSSRSVADRYGFDFCTTDEKDIIENDDINTIFIATRHDSHANYVMKALNAGKHVFVEKPLCLSIEQLDEIAKLFAQGSKDKGYNFLMVGYNRRFSPLIRKVKNKLGHGPMAIIYRINAGAIPIDSWYQDLELGGGRIVGEICHFVDTLSFLTKSLIVSVYATSMSEPNNLNDTLNISLKFQNGSIGTISYLANGDKSFPKERIEIFAHGATAIIDDFKDLTFYSKSKKKKKKLIVQDKGQKEEVKSFIKAINGGKIFAMLTPFEEIYNTSLVTFKIVESIRTGNCIKIIF
jgi:predicted dehydrogenase